MLLPFFEWMGGLWSRAPFSEFVWATPLLQNMHLIAVAVFAGAVLLVDIRMLGRGPSETPLAELARSVEPWLIGSFVVLVLSGIPQIASRPLREYYSPFFWWKMQAVLVGVVLTVHGAATDVDANRGRARAGLAQGGRGGLDRALDQRHDRSTIDRADRLIQYRSARRCTTGRTTARMGFRGVSGTRRQTRRASPRARLRAILGLKLQPCGTASA